MTRYFAVVAFEPVDSYHVVVIMYCGTDNRSVHISILCVYRLVVYHGNSFVSAVSAE